MNDTVIAVSGLRCSYGSFEAVKGISLEVRRGELFALLGANGAGKTTTIEVLEGMQKHTGGEVSVFGMHPRRDRAAVRARTGVMLQKGGFSGSLTVKETMDVWRSLTDRPRPAMEALELVGLTDRLGVAVDQLSGGEGRRLELALAVLGRPELLFLDEPTTGMDPASRRTTWEVVRELQNAGTTVLLTTHYLEEAESLADRLAIMKRGEIVTTGTPGEVRRALPSRISFRLPARAPAAPELIEATQTVVGDLVTYETANLQDDLADLLTWAREQAVTLNELSARPASLEDVFLDIVDSDASVEATR